MTIVVLGMPGAFAAWGFEAVQRLVQAPCPDAALRWIDRLDSYEHAPMAASLICSQFPSRDLRAALATHAPPTIIFTNGTFDAVCYQQERHGNTLVEALRTVSLSASLLVECLETRNCLSFNASDGLDAEQILRAVAHRLGLNISSEELQDLLSSLGPVPPRSTGARFLSELDEGAALLVLDSAVSRLRDRGAAVTSIWPHRVFFAGDKPGTPAPLVADATGGARVLYYGPYLHLSAGDWSVRLTLGFSKEAIGLPLRIAAYGPDLLSEVRVRAPQAGIFAAMFQMSVVKPEHAIEFQVSTEEGAIEGRIALGQVELTLLSPTLAVQRANGQLPEHKN